MQKTKCCLSHAGWAVPLSPRCFHMRGLFNPGQQTGSRGGGCLVCSSAVLGDSGTCCRAVCPHLPPCAPWVEMQTHPQPALVGMQTQSHTGSTSLAVAKPVESDWIFSALTLLHLFFSCLPDCQAVLAFSAQDSSATTIPWLDNGREWVPLQAPSGKREISHIYAAHRGSLADVVLWIWLDCPDPYGGMRVLKGTEESYCCFKSGLQ